MNYLSKKGVVMTYYPQSFLFFERYIENCLFGLNFAP
jgi:hypothetical protein